MQRKPGDDLPANLPDVILNYVRLSNPPDQIKAIRKQHLPVIKQNLRQALSGISPDDAIKAASSFDGLITILLLIEAVNDLRSFYIGRLQEVYGADVSSDLVQSFEEMFEKRLDQLLEQKKVLTRADIDGVVQSVQDTCWAKASRKSASVPPDEFKQLIRNLVFTIAASKVYKETDELQMVNISQILATKVKSIFVKPDPKSIAVKIDKLTPEKIKQPYEALAYGFDLVEVTPETAARWREVSCYLQGLYSRIYRAMDKKYKRGKRDDGDIQTLEDGTFPTVDESDKLFKKHKHVTKCEMSFYNRELGLKIQERVIPLMNARAAATPAAAASPLSMGSAVEPRFSQATIDVTSDQKHQKHIIVAMPSDLYASIKEQLIKTIERSLDPFRYENQFSEQLRTRPAYVVDDNEKLDAKLLRLSSCLHRNSLTRVREAMLSFVIEAILSRFEAYRCGGSLVHSLHSRAHVVLLHDYIDRLEVAANIAEKIHILIELRNELISRKSVDLLGGLNEGLSAVYDVLALRFPSVAVIKAERRITDAKGITTLDMPVSDCDKDRLDSLVEAIRVVLLQSNASKLSGDILPFLLLQMNHSRVSEKVIVLGACLRVVQLTDSQNENLGILNARVSACIQSYCATSNYGLFRKVHVPAALDFMDAITGSNLTKDLQLSRLLDFRNALLALNSVTLLPDIDKLLVSVFEVLLVNEVNLSVRAAAAAR